MTTEIDTDNIENWLGDARVDYVEPGFEKEIKDAIRARLIAYDKLKAKFDALLEDRKNFASRYLNLQAEMDSLAERARGISKEELTISPLSLGERLAYLTIFYPKTYALIRDLAGRKEVINDEK